MARKKKIKVSLGDVFAIPVNGNTYSYGQLVYRGATSDVFIIFDMATEQSKSLKEIVKSPILFMVNSVDIKLEDGEWLILGKEEIPESLSLKNYIAETLDGYVVLDPGGKGIREATEADIKNLTTLTSYSPFVIERAIQARFGDGEWEDYLDELLYKP